MTDRLLKQDCSVIKKQLTFKWHFVHLKKIHFTASLPIILIQVNEADTVLWKTDNKRVMLMSTLSIQIFYWGWMCHVYYLNIQLWCFFFPYTDRYYSKKQKRKRKNPAQNKNISFFIFEK